MENIQELNRHRNRLKQITHEINKLNQALDQLNAGPVLVSHNREDRRLIEKDFRKAEKLQLQIDGLKTEGEKISERMRELINDGKGSLPG